MPVGLYTGPNTHTGNGVTTVFAYDFKILQSADLKVTVDGVVTTTGFTVSGVGASAGGSITFSTAPANGAAIVLSRSRAYSRTTDYQRNGSFDEETVDADFDAVVMLIQQLDAAQKRAIKAPESVSADQVISAADWAARASKFFGFNSGGALALFAIADVAPSAVSAFIATLIDDPDAATARNTLGAVGLTGAETIAGVKTFSSKPVLPATVPVTNEAVSRANGDSLYGPSYGLTLSNNVSDPTNDIDIAAGAKWDSTRAVRMVLASALTKRLDAAWAVGTGNGGLDTGSIANTTYHVFLIMRSDTGVVDVLFSTSPTSPTMPANYDYKRRIGSFVRISNAIRKFVQNGSRFMYTVTGILDVNATNPGASAVTRTLSVPTGIAVEAVVSITLDAITSQSMDVLLTSLDQDDVACDATNRTAGIFNTNGDDSQLTVVAQVKTNTSAQVRSRCGSGSTSDVLRISTLGFIDFSLTED